MVHFILILDTVVSCPHQCLGELQGHCKEEVQVPACPKGDTLVPSIMALPRCTISLGHEGLFAVSATKSSALSEGPQALPG